jgi:hypothetical protein
MSGRHTTEHEQDRTPADALQAVFGPWKSAAALYVDASEEFAKQLLSLQASATSWAKDTPLAPLFEMQNAIGQRLVEFSSSATRSLLQLESAKS